MKNNQDTWRFFVQVAFSTIVLSFSLYKLAVPGQQDSYQALYWGGVTGIMAWWMPSPGGSSQNGSQTEKNQSIAAVVTSANGQSSQIAAVSKHSNEPALPSHSN